MGHIEWGRLPGYPAWNRVLANLQAGRIDVPKTAQDTALAAERRLITLQGDPSLSYCIWLLLRLATAARGEDFRTGLNQIGLDLSPDDTAMSFIAQVADVARERLRHHPESGPFGEMAALALRRALTETVGRESGSLFGSSVDDIERAFRRYSTGTQFGLLAKRFFGDFFARTLRYYIDRELENVVGHAGLPSIGSMRDFNDALDLHARQSAGNPRSLHRRLVPQKAVGKERGDRSRRCSGVRNRGGEEASYSVGQAGGTMTVEPIRALIHCDNAPIPPDLETQDWDVKKRLRTTDEDPDAEVNLKIESIFGKFNGQISGRSIDLIRIAAFCYVADQFVTRDGRADVHREHWRRRMTLCIEVSDPAFWSRTEVAKALTAALAFATDDDWTFVFSEESCPPKVTVQTSMLAPERFMDLLIL